MQKPRTRPTRAGEVAFAWQSVGGGPVDLVHISGRLHRIDVVREHPGYRRFLEALANNCPVILFDKRGSGMSDRNGGAPTLEGRAGDIRAVMDAVGSRQAAFFGISEGGSKTAMFAACYPERVRAIVPIGCALPALAAGLDPQRQAGRGRPRSGAARGRPGRPRLQTEVGLAVTIAALAPGGEARVGQPARPRGGLRPARRAGRQPSAPGRAR